jgi:hypothetical protein
MGYVTTRSEFFKPSWSRRAFPGLGAGVFIATEFGRYVNRPHFQAHRTNDLGLADCMGNLGGIVVQIFLGLAILNPSRRQSYRLAVFFAVGYVVYEFAQPYLPKGVFDWPGVYGAAIGFMISVLLLAVVWRVVESGAAPRQSSRTDEPRGSEL